MSRRTYFTVGTNKKPLRGGGLFREFRSPKDGYVRAMDKEVFDDAVDSADEKLREFLRDSDTSKKSAVAS